MKRLPSGNWTKNFKEKGPAFVNHLRIQPNLASKIFNLPPKSQKTAEPPIKYSINKVLKEIDRLKDKKQGTIKLPVKW